MNLLTRVILLVFTSLLCAFSSGAQVVANFTVSPASHCPPLLATFTNHSTGAAGFIWNLGNGDPIIYTSSIAGLSSTYTIPGVYTPTLTAYNGTDTQRFTQTITVFPNPVADFHVSDTSVCPFANITFYSDAIGEVPGPVVSDWNFGDGDTGIGQTRSHIYTYPERFSVTLTAYNADGCPAQVTKTGLIHIYTPPQPYVSAPTYYCHPPAVVPFTDSVVGTSPYSYSWSFGDLGTSTLACPTHTYNTSGPFSVKLLVTDGHGCIDTLVRSNYIYVSNIVASFTPVDTACIFTPVNFYNTSSAWQSLRWKFGDGHTSVSSPGVNTFGRRGLDTVSLIISDSLCMDSVSHPIYVRPGPTASFTQNPLNPCWPPPMAVTFTGSVPSGSSVTWFFGDGSPSASGPTVTHNFMNRGVDTIRMIVSDPHTGCVDTVMRIDTLYDYYLNPNFDPHPLEGCIPFHASFFTGPQTYEPGDTNLAKTYPFPANYTWNFGDGGTSNAPSPGHIYTAPGIYTADVYAITSNGCISMYSVTATVGTVRTATFTATPRHVCYSDSVLYKATPRGDTISFYSWTFGDLPTSVNDSIDTIYHVDYDPGIFSVTLTPVYNGCLGNQFVRTDYIRVDSPKAVIHSLAFCPPSTGVQFGDSSLGDDSRVWIFGDGDTSHAKNPFHTYPSAGLYVVHLATYNATSGCRDTALQPVAFSTGLNPAFSTPDTTVCINDLVIFNPVESNATQYSWYLNSIFKSNNAAFPWEFPDTGLYTVSLVLEDENHCYYTMTKTNYMHVGHPYINNSLSTNSGCWPLAVTFTDRTKDVRGATYSDYVWSFGDGSSTTAFTAATTHSYSAAGVYTVTETVTDNIGCSSIDTVPIPVTVHVHPVASFHVSNKTPCRSTPVFFTNSSSGATGPGIWSFGDGVVSSSPVHVYTTSGYYEVKLTAANSFLCINTADTVNYIYVPPDPVASFGPIDSFSICHSLSVHFRNSSLFATSYKWFSGDGATSNRDTPTFNYTTAGLDTVILVASDAYGCSDTARGHVRMFGYNGDFSYSVDSGCVPLRVKFSAVDIDSVPAIFWDFSGGFTDSTGFSDTVWYTYTESGSYLPLLILKGNGCVSTSYGLDSIKVGAIPVVPGITGRDSVCAEAVDSLFNSTPGGVWRSNADTIAAIDSFSGIVSGLVAGNAMITYSVKNNCGTKDTFKMVVVKLLPDAGVIVGDSAVCRGYSITLSDTVTGGLCVDNDTSVASFAGGNLTGLKPGADDIYYVFKNSCGSDTARKLITVNPLPDSGRITGLADLCEGATTIIKESVPGGKWSGNNAIIAVDSVTGQVHGLTTGTSLITYTTKTDSNGCYNAATFPVSIVLPFTISGTVSQVSCHGDSNGSVTLDVMGNLGRLKYRWSNNDSTSIVNGLAPGSYLVSIADDTTLCIVKDSFMITQPDSLLLIGETRKDTCKEGNGSVSVLVSGGSYPYRYLWSTNGTDSTLNKLLSGTYTVQVTDLNNCQKGLSVVVEDTCNEIIIHDVITPNGDGINDMWEIEGIANYPQNTVEIFDKWGTLLYKKQNYGNDWYGRDDKGDLLPDGTYYYLVKLNATNARGSQNAFTGAILIKR